MTLHEISSVGILRAQFERRALADDDLLCAVNVLRVRAGLPPRRREHYPGAHISDEAFQLEALEVFYEEVRRILKMIVA